MDKKSRPDRDIQLDRIIDDFDKKQQLQHSKEEKALRRVRRQAKIRKVLLAVCIIVGLGIAGYLGAFILGKNLLVRHPLRWIAGSRIPEDYRIDRCIFHMWQVRKAIDLYFTQNADFPPDIETLYARGFLTEKITCPATGARYIIQEADKGPVFCCPNPEEHGVARICASVESGPPVIEQQE